MENVMSIPSAARVNCHGLVKWVALNKRCFVVKLLFVTILPSFQCNFVGTYIFYLDL